MTTFAILGILWAIAIACLINADSHAGKDRRS